ncbi:caspase-12-like isoform X2 [Mustela erminea]|uniref:caspase-12-like isoform X2 n=1 Tax=Mustela erminea TaxID=36723 RepID=UPI0013870B39|nr:caspase-12-like isoform X2 [Mustela erminea]
MAEKRSLQDPVKEIKMIASTMLGGFLEDLKEKKVLDKRDLQTIGKKVNFIVNKTENLVDDLSEKTQLVGQVFMDRLVNSKSLLSLKNEDEESESSESSSLTESEDESESESEEEENAKPSQALALPLAGATKPSGSCKPSCVTQEKRSPRDPVNEIKVIASTVLGGVLEDLKEKKVIDKQELQIIGNTVNVIVNKTENLVSDFTEKTQMVGKVLKDHFFNSRKLLSIKNEDEESESSESSSLTESEDESESEEEENAKPSQALALPLAGATKPSGSCKPSCVTQVIQEIQDSSMDMVKICPCKHSQEPKTVRVQEVYPMMEKEGRTRLALIICNKVFDHLSEREGSENDILGMQGLLENLGYSVVIKENLTALEMITELKNFATRPEHQFSDSTFLVFMSHGTLGGICGRKHRDEEPDILPDDTIFQIFNNRSCHGLKDKPKVIITQACRGSDGAVWVTDMGEALAWTCYQPLERYISSDAIKKTHVEKDFIAFKSSTPHNVSWRLNTKGSIFISQLIHYLGEYSCCHHLEEIFRKVQNAFEKPNAIIQMPTIERLSMTRYFYLFPGN